MTVANFSPTNILTTNISTSTLNASTGITCANANITNINSTYITCGQIYMTNFSDSGIPSTQGHFLTVDGSNFTDTVSLTNTTTSNMVFNSFQGSTLNATNPITTTNAITLFIDNPITGTNQTISNSYALWVSGNIYIDGYINSNFLNNSVRLTDEKSAGTNGGTFTSGAWRTRDLNVIIGGGTWGFLASNQLTLLVGTYVITAYCPAVNAGNHTSIFYNTTDSTTIAYGMSTSSPSGGITGTCTTLAIIYNLTFSITSTKVFELRHRCSSTTLNTGFGIANGWTTEIYSMVYITKLQ